MITFFLLSGLLATGYMGDDAYNSQIIGSLIHSGQSVLFRTYEEMLGWARGAGRVFPLSWYYYIFFYFVTSRLLYKIISICVVLSSVGLFSWWVALSSRSKKLGIISFFVVPTFFQFRAWHDPLLSFGFMVPVVTIYLFSSFILFQKYLDTQKSSFAIWSAVLYGIALLTYEISYLAFIVYFLMAFDRFRNIKAAIKASLPQTASAVALVILVMLLRTKLNPYFTNSYPGATVHGDLIKVWQAFLIQTWAAFPLSYYLREKTHLRQYLNNFDFVVFGVVLSSVFFLMQTIREKINSILLMLFGAVLLMTPALMIAVSGHQDELITIGYGLGYIAVFLQYFGMFLLLTGLFFLIRSQTLEHLRTVLNFSYAFLVVVFVFHNLGQNRFIILGTLPHTLFSRETLRVALKSPLFQELNSSAVILRNMRYPHDHKWFYASHTLKKLTVEEPKDYFNNMLLKSFVEKKKVDAKDVFHLKSCPSQFSCQGEVVSGSALSDEMYLSAYSFDHQRGESGIVYLAQLDHFTYDVKNEKFLELSAKKLKAFDYKTGEIQTLSREGDRVDFNLFLAGADSLPLHIQDFQIEDYQTRRKVPAGLVSKR
jgi:hypothetical protein